MRSQQVVVATADGNEAVIAAGLVPGMLVVSAGVHVLSPGQKVTIWQDKTAALPALAVQPQAVPAALVQAVTVPAKKLTAVMNRDNTQRAKLQPLALGP